MQLCDSAARGWYGRRGFAGGAREAAAAERLGEGEVGPGLPAAPPRRAAAHHRLELLLRAEEQLVLRVHLGSARVYLRVFW